MPVINHIWYFLTNIEVCWRIYYREAPEQNKNEVMGEQTASPTTLSQSYKTRIIVNQSYLVPTVVLSCSMPSRSLKDVILGTCRRFTMDESVRIPHTHTHKISLSLSLSLSATQNLELCSYLVGNPTLRHKPQSHLAASLHYFQRPLYKQSKSKWNACVSIGYIKRWLEILYICVYIYIHPLWWCDYRGNGEWGTVNEKEKKKETETYGSLQESVLLLEHID